MIDLAELRQVLTIEGEAAAESDEAWVSLLNSAEEWAPRSWTMEGDRKELQGLFDRKALRMITECSKTARYIPSKMVRRLKGEGVKSRMCLRDVAYARPEGGELFASTPSVTALRTLTMLAAYDRAEAEKRGEGRHGVLCGDATQAFVQAEIDQEMVTRVTADMAGIIVEVNGERTTLLEGQWLAVEKALYGYRRSPRLWQDHLAAIVTELKACELKRATSEPAVYFEFGKRMSESKIASSR